MRVIILAAALLFAVLASARGQQAMPQGSALAPDAAADVVTGRVRGRVLDRGRGLGLGRATVTLRATDPRKTSHQATSDEEGRFGLDQVEPGRYMLVAERPGFITQVYGATRRTGPGTTLSVSSGQTLEIVVDLVAQGVVGGRVAGPDGEPQSGLPVLAFQFQYLAGALRLVPVRLSPAVTDDRGEYRIPDLAPGRYYMGTSPQRLGRSPETAAQVKRDEKEAEHAPVQTYYPGTVDPGGAAAVDVPAGGEVLGVDWALGVERVFRIAGTLVNGHSAVPAGGTLILYRRYASGISSLPTSMVGARGGAFEMRNVPAGAYALLAMSDNVQGPAIASMPLEVGGNVEGVVVALGAGTDIPVVARWDPPQVRTPAPVAGGGREAVSLQTLRVALRPLENPYAPVASAQLDDDVKGVLRSVAPGGYTVAVTGLPAGTYLKAATYGDQDALQSTGIQVADREQPLVLAIGTPAASLSGTAVDARGNPVTGAIVTAVPATPGRLDMIVTSTTDQHGAFEMSGVVPAEYRVFAWEDVEIGAVASEEFMSGFLARGARVRVSAGRAGSVTLRVVPRDMTDAVEARR